MGKGTRIGLGQVITAAFLACLAAPPAAADVRAGVAAWERGDYARAVREWEGPARSGDRDAQFNLAQAYRLGRGVPVDLKRAEELYVQAAAQGHPKAADTLGLMLYQAGRRAEALPYLETAAARGDPRAQYLYGITLFNGDLLPRNWLRAYALLTLAERGGLAQARAALTQLDAHLSSAEREQALALAATLGAAVPAGRTSPQVTDQPPPAGEKTSEQAPSAATPPATSPQPVPPPRVPLSAGHVPALPGLAGAGPWRLQLGVFAVPGNADALWARLAGRPELAGLSRLPSVEGRLTRLVAAGFATRQAAQAACDSLAIGGQPCLVIR